MHSCIMLFIRSTNNHWVLWKTVHEISPLLFSFIQIKIMFHHYIYSLILDIRVEYVFLEAHLCHSDCSLVERCSHRVDQYYCHANDQVRNIAFLPSMF